MSKIILIIFAIIFFHAIYNLFQFLRFGHIEELFVGFFSTESKIKLKSMSSKKVVLDYIKYSGVHDKHIAIAQAIGYGKIASSTVSVFDNISNPHEDIAYTTYELLLEAKGNYWLKFVNSINPIYWLRVILFIPKHIFSYLGLNSESIVIKILQLIYWFLGIIFTVLVSVYPEEVKVFILSFINRF